MNKFNHLKPLYFEKNNAFESNISISPNDPGIVKDKDISIAIPMDDMIVYSCKIEKERLYENN